MRAVGAVIALALGVSSGCVYGIKSLKTRPTSVAELPADQHAESARRTSRRLWSLAGGAVEVGAGAFVRFLASRSGRDRDAVVLDGVSELFLMFGAGDLALSVADSFVSTPFVGESGQFQRPDHFDDSAVAPSPRLQVDAGAAVSLASQRRVESHYDVAYFHWISPVLRMRYQLGVDRGGDFAGTTTQVYYGVGGGASLEWNPGERRHYGRHPNSALFAIVQPRVILGEGRDTAAGWRASVGWELGPMMIGVGATQIVGDDRVPGVEAWFGIRPIPTD